MDVVTKKLSEIQTFLKFTYGIVPIVAGADKFTNLLADWGAYLNPSLAHILPMSSNIFMMVVGGIEVGAGIMVLLSPQKAAFIISAWLVLIALSLLVSGSYLDVAIRDLVIAVGAYALGKLSRLPGISKPEKEVAKI